MNAYSVFYQLPQPLKNLTSTIYGLIQKKRRYGGDYESLIQIFLKNEYKSRELLYNESLHKLRDMLIHCSRNVPFYKNILSVKDIESAQSPLEALRKIPVLTKNELRLKNDSFISLNAIQNNNLKFHYTSGSTGTPLRVYTLPRDDQFNFALHNRYLSYGNVSYENRKIMFGGKPIVSMKQKKPPFWVENYFEKQLYCSSYHMSMNNLRYYHEKILKFSPEFIIGYASAITLYAKYIKSLGIKYDGKKLSGVFTSSELLAKENRRLIEKIFKCKVYDGYSLAEYVTSVTQCEFGEYHISPEAGILEILDADGNNLKNGEVGRIVCSTLFNDTMPLLRYDTGDLGAKYVDGYYCKCGRTTEILMKLEGRAMSYLVLPNDKKVGSAGLTTGFINNEIIEAQFVQNNVHETKLNLVVTNNFSVEDERILINEMDRRLNPLKIKVEYVNEIKSGKNGKKDLIINNLEKNRYS